MAGRGTESDQNGTPVCPDSLSELRYSTHGEVPQLRAQRCSSVPGSSLEQALNQGHSLHASDAGCRVLVKGVRAFLRGRDQS